MFYLYFIFPLIHTLANRLAHTHSHAYTHARTCSGTIAKIPLATQAPRHRAQQVPSVDCFGALLLVFNVQYMEESQSQNIKERACASAIAVFCFLITEETEIVKLTEFTRSLCCC